MVMVAHVLTNLSEITVLGMYKLPISQMYTTADVILCLSANVV